MTYEEGKKAAIAWNTSPYYQQFDRGLKTEDIMSLFLPPIDGQPEGGLQMSTPLPRPYQEWIRGFNENRINGSLNVNSDAIKNWIRENVVIVVDSADKSGSGMSVNVGLRFSDEDETFTTEFICIPDADS